MRKKYLGMLIIGILLASVACPLALNAAESDTTQISGTVPTSITVSAPDTVTMPSLLPGTTVLSAAQTVTVDTNTNGWQLSVVESGTPDGLMEKSGSITLGSPMQVDGGDNGGYASLASAVSLKDGTGETSGHTEIADVVFRQVVGSTDRAGEYSITVTFTATAGS